MRKAMIAFVLSALLLSACGGQTSEVTTEPTEAPTTQTTQPTVATAPAVTTEEILRQTVQNQGMIVMEGSITLTSELVLINQYLDGGGHTLTGPVYQDGVAATENTITTTGGTINNLTVQAGYRGIGDSRDYRVSRDVRLNNVTVNGTSGYCINFGYGNQQAGLYAENCTFNGWSSYTNLKEAAFTNCTFGWGENNANLRPYVDTWLSNCRFEGRTEADGSFQPFQITFKWDTRGVTLVLENCYAGDTLITQENLEQLLHIETYGNEIRVDNTVN